MVLLRPHYNVKRRVTHAMHCRPDRPSSSQPTHTHTQTHTRPPPTPPRSRSSEARAWPRRRAPRPRRCATATACARLRPRRRHGMPRATSRPRHGLSARPGEAGESERAQQAACPSEALASTRPGCSGGKEPAHCFINRTSSSCTHSCGTMRAEQQPDKIQACDAKASHRRAGGCAVRRGSDGSPKHIRTNASTTCHPTSRSSRT